MKKVIVILFLIGAASALAHDEGHGPKLTDQGKQGGVLSAVVDKKDASKGEKAALVYKSELVRSEDGTVRVYLYDKDMNPLDLSKLDKKSKGLLAFKKNRKWTSREFPLEQSEGAFVGKAPQAGSKPFNIDLYFKEGSRDLLTAFDNLD